MDQLLYGAAYYDEYMPYERLDKDISMMKKAGINVIRIAESTWSTEEPEEGVFDFSHVTKVLDACEKEGLYVIVEPLHTPSRPGWQKLTRRSWSRIEAAEDLTVPGRSWISPILPIDSSRSASSAD